MELKSLYTVKKIVEVGSYQKAAVALNYAQSTITFQIKQLENELGIRLFEKSGSRMVLTQEGRAVLPLIEQVIEASDRLLCFKSEHAALSGTLKIALPESLVTYQLQEVLKIFKQQAPHVKLSLQVLNCYAIYELLLRGGADLAIHYDVRSYPQSIVTQALHAYPLVMVAAPELDEKEADFVTPQQRKTVVHIQNDPQALYLKVLNAYLKQKQIVLETGLEVWSIEAVKRSVMSNLGVAFLPRFTVEAELAQGLLKECPMELADETITAICAYSKNKWKSPAMELFLQILGRYFSITDEM